MAERTLPHEASELATAAALARLERAVQEARLAVEGDPEAAEESTREAVQASRALRRAWELLERGSPFRRSVIPQARQALESLSGFGGIPDLPASALVEEERAEVILHAARQAIADALETALGATTLRDAASRAGLSAGYLSDLRQGKAGLPSEDVAARLDSELGVDISMTSTAARNRAAEARARSRERGRHGTSPSSPDVARLARLTEALTRDRTLMDLIDRVMDMSPPARRALSQLLEHLEGEPRLKRRLEGGA
ncbi:MAG: helix-turn-helix domain-containing protein [Actinomycetota bacterium]